MAGIAVALEVLGGRMRHSTRMLPRISCRCDCVVLFESGERKERGGWASIGDDAMCCLSLTV